jgi:Tfp pilus assembly protein PilX
MQSTRHRQSGTVLFIVIMLLLLASVLTVATLNVGVFEQHTSGNDLKAKMVGEVAEAGLSQGMEYLHSNPTFLVNTSKWTQCTATDTSFPCGSVPSSRRVTMYRWSGGGYDFDGNGTIAGWETKMLPITGPITTTGGNMSVQYGVGAVLCRVAFKTLATDPTTCTNSGSASNTSIVTLVSVAYIPGEGARSTVTQSVGSYNIINNLPAVPPIVASGSVNIYGTLQVVTNPNAAGTGEPVSIWSPQSSTGHGTANTCYANDFYTGGSVDWSHAAALPTFPLCDSCSCNPSLSSVSGNDISNHNIDIIDGVDATLNGTGGNNALHLDADQTKTEFPCDLFQKIFNVQAWEDDLPSGSPPGDGFCETHLLTTYTNPNNTNQVVIMGKDDAYLYANANYILPASRTYPCFSGCVGTLTATALRDSTQTTATQSGLVWCQDGSLCATGTPELPVLVVIDGGTTLSGDIYGLVFLKSTDDTSTFAANYPSPGKHVPTGVSLATGGNATLDMHANGTVYGSIVLQGTSGHINGTSAVVYNQDVLTALQNSGSFVKFGGVPGGWTDKTSY